MTETSNLFAQYPPRWEIYDWYKDHVPAHIMGFAVGHGDIVRFGARYRFANSFRGIHLEDVSTHTIMRTEWDRLMTELEEEMDSIFNPPDDAHYSAWDSI
jgi:hypothetical protein